MLKNKSAARPLLGFNHGSSLRQQRVRKNLRTFLKFDGRRSSRCLSQSTAPRHSQLAATGKPILARRLTCVCGVCCSRRAWHRSTQLPLLIQADDVRLTTGAEPEGSVRGTLEEYICAWKGRRDSVIVSARALRSWRAYSETRPTGTRIEVYVTACQFSKVGEDEK